VTALRGGDAARNAARIRAILDGESGPARDVVVLNSAAVLVAADVAAGFADGVSRAAESIDSGAARERLHTLITVSNQAAA
jgi:anthranilate phosphoribosyltransferase